MVNRVYIEKPQLLKSKTTRIIVKYLNKSLNNQKRKTKPQDTKSSEFEPLQLLVLEARKP
jgi:hypothetical protein